MENSEIYPKGPFAPLASMDNMDDSHNEGSHSMGDSTSQASGESSAEKKSGRRKPIRKEKGRRGAKSKPATVSGRKGTEDITDLFSKARQKFGTLKAIADAAGVTQGAVHLWASAVKNGRKVLVKAKTANALRKALSGGSSARGKGAVKKGRGNVKAAKSVRSRDKGTNEKSGFVPITEAVKQAKLKFKTWKRVAEIVGVSMPTATKWGSLISKGKTIKAKSDTADGLKKALGSSFRVTSSDESGGRRGVKKGSRKAAAAEKSGRGNRRSRRGSANFTEQIAALEAAHQIIITSKNLASIKGDPDGARHLVSAAIRELQNFLNS